MTAKSVPIKGFAYVVPERLRGSGFENRTYESIRRNRPLVIRHLRQVHEANSKIVAPKCIVYVAINTINNKLYVGVTSTGLEKRKKHHFQTAKQGGYGLFTRAIRKYGKEAFEFLIFGICRDYERALFAEQELIACICPEYNLTAGGEGMTGYKPSQETLRRLSASHIGKPGPWAGKKRSIDSIEKMVSTRRERGNYIGHSRGEKRPPEVCENVRIGRKNGKTPRPLSPEMIERRSIRFKAMNAKQGRQVRCIDDGLVFPSIKSAAQHYGIAISPVGRVVHGQAKMAKGRRFEFV